MQCWDTRAKYWFNGSSTRAAARRRRAAAISDGDARWVLLEAMNRSRKTPPGGVMVMDGSAWM